jgi:mannose-1-phosphate guanylyltransferase/phosphomannomutase
MKAVVMAGGFGTRLRPLTAEYPKPMIPVVNKPVLAHILNLLKHHHFSEVVITVQYLADQIQNYFGDGRHLGMAIRYVVEDKPLGTAGSVKNAQQYLADEPFLVMSGDLITDFDLSSMLRFHRERRALATLALTYEADPSEYGTVATDRQERIREYVEKPDPEEVISRTVNTGIYMLEPEVLDDIAPNVAYDFSEDIFPQMLSQDTPPLGYTADGYWCDMGTLEDYMQVTADVLAGKVRHIDLGQHLGNDLWAGRDVEIAPDATLSGPIYLGHRVKVNPGASIYGPTVIADQTVIGKGAHVERAIIGRACFLGELVKVQKCIIADQYRLAPGVAALKKVMTGEATQPW